MSFKTVSEAFLAFPRDEVFDSVPAAYKIQSIDTKLKPQIDKDKNLPRNEKLRSLGESRPARSAASHRVEEASINELISSLEGSRSQVSTYAREQVFKQIINHLQNGVDTDVSDESVRTLVAIMKKASPEKEAYFATRALLFVAVHNTEYTAYVTTAVTAVARAAWLENLEASVDFRSGLSNAVFTLRLVTGGARELGIPDEIDLWLDAIEKPDIDEKLVVSALYGIGVLLSLLVDVVESNATIENILPALIPYFTDERKRVSVAAGSLISQCFQNYVYDGDDDLEVPYFDKEDLLSILESKERENIRGLTKSDRQSVNVAYRLFHQCVEQNLSAEARRNSPDPELLATVGLGTRKLQISAWRFLVRLNFLRWAFGAGLAELLQGDEDGDQLDISGVLTEGAIAPVQPELGTVGATETVEVEVGKYERAQDGKSRDLAISRARDAKWREVYDEE